MELEREKLGGIYQVLVKNSAEALMFEFQYWQTNHCRQL